MNINTKEYWETRFLSNWKGRGERQTKEYALANVEHMPLPKTFEGTLLDFGCAMGDAIPTYAQTFARAKLKGIDISEAAIDYCREKYGQLAEFHVGDAVKCPVADVIIASHVMEHITDDKKIMKLLLPRCKELFVFVPFKENPLYIEHVNYYEEDYYDDLKPLSKVSFTVRYKVKSSLKTFVKNILKLKFAFTDNFSKDVIMFHFKGSLEEN